MRALVAGLVDELRGLGESYLGLLRAEIDVLVARLTRTAQGAGKAAAFGGAALYLLLLAVPGLLIFAAVDLLSAWREWPYWLSALVVAGGVLLVIAILALIARRVWQREVEMPTATLKRRLDDHASWWHQRLLYERPELVKGDDDEF